MRSLFVSIFLILGVTAFSQELRINDKNAEVRNVSGFNAIRVSGAIDLFLSQGNTEAVAVSGSEKKYIDKIKTEVVNGTLKIYYDGDKLSWNTTNKKLKAYVSFKQINALEASGASDVKISGTINATALEINLSGASDLDGALKVGDLKITSNGASDVKITGSATNINIEAGGASDVKGYDFTVENCTAKATGASDIHLTVNKEISAHASGASSVFYKGDAVMKDVHTSGASSVGKKG